MERIEIVLSGKPSRRFPLIPAIVVLTKLQVREGRGAAALGYAFPDPRFERTD